MQEEQDGSEYQQPEYPGSWATPADEGARQPAEPGDPEPGDPAPDEAAPGEAAPGDFEAAPGGAAPVGAAPGGAAPGGAAPGSAARRTELDTISRQLVAGTASISLTSRMVFGKPEIP